MKKIVFFVLCSFTLLSCEKFLDINTDPNNPATATPEFLLPSAQVSYVFAFSGNYDRLCATLVQQIVNRRFDRYFINPAETGLSNSWRFDIFAGALKDLENIIVQSTNSGAFAYVGVAKLQKAYIYSLMVDLYGDLPFQDALKGDQQLYPPYEDDAVVYDKVLALIDEGLADLDKPSSSNILASADLIYGGSLAKWRKMGNTLKLKLYNQIRLVDPVTAQTKINELLADPSKLITAAADDFQLKYGKSTAPQNQHPNFQADYVLASREDYMSNTFFALLTNLADPRLPYYIYNQTNNVFIGRIPGSAAAAGNDANTRSLFGLFPVGGKFGGSGPANVNSGPGDAPFRMITSYMKDFIAAEAQLMLNNDPVAARTAFEAAMNAAFAKVNEYAVASSAAQIPGGNITAYVNARLADYDNANNNNDKLNVVITQKYIALFGCGVEAYNDFRRTGFPVISVIPDPLADFPLRMPYDLNEFQGPNPPQQLPLTTPIFWDL